MRLGLAELRRSPGRFGAVAGAVGFIVFLALILAALSDGLYLGSTGAYRTSSAQVFVFSQGSDFGLTSSTIDPETTQAVGQAPGVEAVGRLSVFNTTATSDGKDLQLSLVGADPVTMPVDLVSGRLPEDGSLEVLVDNQTRRRGVDTGSTISVTDGPDLAVVGVARDAGFGTATAWAGHDTFQQVRARVRPELVGLAGTSEALGVAAEGTDPSQVIAAIDNVEGVEAATTQQAIDALPAASQQKSTLGAIVNTTFVVAAIVVGLFFALVTLEKRNEFAVLKAIGMSNRILIGSIFTQAIVASLVGFGIGFALSRVVAAVIPPDVPALFLGGTAATLLVTTLVMGALGAIFSLRRIARIDPATALGT